MDDAEDVCVVCMDALDSDHTHTMEHCGHKFHSRCIIGWLQRGNLSCPTCRDNLLREDGLSCMGLIDRGRYIRRTYGRRAAIPVELKCLIAKLRKSEEAERVHKRLIREFTRENRDVLQQNRSLRTRAWKLRVHTRGCLRTLGFYQGMGLRLPALVVRA